MDFVDSTSLGDRDHDIEPYRNEIIFKFINKLHENKKNDKIIKFINNWITEFKEIKKKNMLEEKLKDMINDFDECF